MINQLLYKILTNEDYERARGLGYPTTALDVGDGYVHLSTRAQVGETLALHYKSVDGVYLLEFASDDLDQQPGLLRWELSRGGQLFPHYYANLLLSLTRRQWVLSLDVDGIPQLPADLNS